MTSSVHTNTSALIALQNLNRTNERLEAVQGRVNTGLKVQGAKDNASVWAIAHVRALSRELLNDDFQALLRSISQAVQNSEFDGANLLDGSLTNGVRFLANAEADSFVTLSTRDLSLGGGIIDLTLSSNLLNMSDAATALADLNSSISQVNSALGALGSQAKQIEAHNGFVSRLMDTVESGIGNLVDADLAKESARLTALQVQQQLGVQALSIANQAPQVILSLFRGG